MYINADNIRCKKKKKIHGVKYKINSFHNLNNYCNQKYSKNNNIVKYYYNNCFQFEYIFQAKMNSSSHFFSL